MIKKIYSSSSKILSFMLVLGMQNACAEDVQSMRDMGNFTIGAGLMYENANVKYSTDSYDFIDSQGFYHGLNNVCLNHNYRMLSPVVNLGVSYIYKNLYIGLDGEVIIGRSKTIDYESVVFDGDVGYSKIKGFAYGLKGKLGGFIDSWNTAVYGIVGFRSRDMKFFVDDKKDYEFNSIKIKKPAIVLGIGIEKPIYKQLSVSAEYEYVWRKHGRILEAGNPGAEDGSRSMFNMNFDTKLREYSFKIGLKYRF